MHLSSKDKYYRNQRRKDIYEIMRSGMTPLDKPIMIIQGISVYLNKNIPPNEAHMIGKNIVKAVIDEQR